MTRPSRPSAFARRRYVTVIALAGVLTFAVALVALVVGSYDTSPGEVIQALLGRADERTELVVRGLRVPRILLALLVGAALGVAGAIFQTLTRNPLGSPDVVGFSTGSATGAIACLVVVQPAADPAIGAWAGGLITLMVVLLIAQSTGLARERTILAGIALGAMLASVNEYLLTRAPTEVAKSATLWLFGSLSASDYQSVVRMAVVLAVVAVALSLIRSDLRVLELGDELACALGVSVSRSRLVLMLLAVVLTGIATSVCGPIGFVALAAPQIARRLSRTTGIPLVPSAAVGACLLVCADVAAQRALAPLQIPVGLVTGVFGGAYLFWLVVRTRR